MKKDMVRINKFERDDVDMESIVSLYCLTFLDKPITEEIKQSIYNNINKHGNYPGFIGLKATDQYNRVIGFIYGYTSLPEQFYHHKIKAQLSTSQAELWLTDSFEFVELAVHQEFRQQGIGSQLLCELLNRIDHQTAVLTTGIGNITAIQFYQNRSWNIIRSDAPIISSESLQVIMGIIL